MQEFTHGKGQEIAATDQLLKRLDKVDGAVITFDALHTHHALMEKVVVEKNADYLIQVKDNAPALKQSIVRAFELKANQIQSAGTFDFGHGRIETRSGEIIPLSPLETGWPHTYLACRVTRVRHQLRRSEVVDHAEEQAFYVASFPVTHHSANKVLQFIRGHWGIENELHHPKDRSMDEDRCRASAAGIGRTLAYIRGFVAQISRRTTESLGVIRCRFARQPHVLIKLLSTPSLLDWERCSHPYKTR